MSTSAIFFRNLYTLLCARQKPSNFFLPGLNFSGRGASVSHPYLITLCYFENALFPNENKHPDNKIIGVFSCCLLLPTARWAYSAGLMRIRKSNKLVSVERASFLRKRYRLTSTPLTDIFISCATSLVLRFMS